jgi:SAM-dependent methyltransferase
VETGSKPEVALIGTGTPSLPCVPELCQAGIAKRSAAMSALIPVRLRHMPLLGALRGTGLRRKMRRWFSTAPPPGRIDFGDLRRTRPIDRDFGYTRGSPIDRYYIEGFLARHARDVRGRVLEIGNDAYTRRFGGPAVTQRDVLDVLAANPAATIVADLAQADEVPSDAFDALIITQTLQYVFDIRAAIATLHRILRPGGTVLATVPGITPIYHAERAKTWYWSLTQVSAKRLFEAQFPATHVEVETFGNVLAATCFLQGLAAEDLTAEELDRQDPAIQLLITARAVKPEPAR